MPSANFTFVTRPGPRTQEAVITAAAAMALADGRAEPVEHRSLLAFLKQHKMLQAFGRAATLERFAAEIERATASRTVTPLPNQQPAATAWPDLTARLRPLAGMEAARMVAAAAAHVAAADGTVNRREIELLDTVRATLGLNPTANEHHAQGTHPKGAGA
jgi:tellurite resistance protein